VKLFTYDGINYGNQISFIAIRILRLETTGIDSLDQFLAEYKKRTKSQSKYELNRIQRLKWFSNSY
jgi:hypothetical protein